MAFDPVELHVFWSFTKQTLDSYARRVDEGKDLDAAITFARYVRNSRLAHILEAHQSDGFLEVDGKGLAQAANQLERAVQDRYRCPKAPITLNHAELEKINHKLDLLAGAVAHILPRSVASAPSSSAEVVPFPGKAVACA
jgi:hypothetical protein